MRLDSNSTTTAVPATTPQSSMDAHLDELTRVIDFPLAPDDVRLHRQTERPVCPAGCSTMLTGLAVTILGIAGVAGGAYFVVDAATTVDDSSVAQSQTRAKYSAGGALLGLGVLAATLGLYRLGMGWEKRSAMASEPQDLHVGEQLEMKAGTREYA
ncbi:hypothetical protein [Pandoraea fibrosis]|uniref:Transmembrane protein n=1 Tax=Pandoraea fibrosis TaxID=1891094 RepID=A0A5E4THU6_9BURK|nr:hypothetical protein [Pandoraea fibrosis]VVD86842.1 hypothetical protein PFI31113_01388 [Pandoraea fibrosis]